jgi:hypothetical protein
VSDKSEARGRLVAWGAISRQELIHALLTVPQWTQFTLYEVRRDAALPGEQAVQLLPLKVAGKELLVKLTVPAGTIRERGD